MKFTNKVALIILLLFGFLCPASSAFNPKQEAISPHRFNDLKQLVQGSDIIGYGNINGVKEQFHTPITVTHGKLVNTVQAFKITKIFKGTRTSVNLLNTGVEPLPRPSDPLNNIYPGPLASGSYILFLKKISGTNYFQLSGGWQAVYPVLNDKSVTLYGIGFKELDQLNVDEFFHKLKRLNES